MTEQTQLPTISWQAFVEELPIGTACYIDIEIDIIFDDNVSPPEILIHCRDPHCNSRIRHESRSFDIPTRPQFIMALLICKACNKQHAVALWAHVIDERLMVKKFGQEPPMGGPLPNALLRLSEGKEKQWIERGRACIRQGHGIAALAYYRLVVEGIVDDLLDKMTKYCDTDEQRELIREAIAKPRLGDKLQAVKECIPKQLMLGLGQNPITFLYSCFSDELHYDTADDAKALEKATHGMNIVCALLELMQDQDRLGQALKASFKALSDQHSQRRPKDRPS